jgi:hypothetical protein
LSTTTDNNGKFVFNPVYASNYEITIGKWGYYTLCQNISISQSDTLYLQLTNGYYDDFSFDFNWSVSSSATTGIWERGAPIFTDFNGTPANPGMDISGDCGEKAFITGNGGGSAGNDDIDDGETTLMSPVFDLSNYSNPLLSYYRWFFNDGGFGSPNDSLKIYITNGTDTVSLEKISATDPYMSTWHKSSFLIKNYISLTSSMQLILKAGDYSPGHLVEAGVDMFMIRDSSNTANINYNMDIPPVSFYPNPAKYRLYFSNFQEIEQIDIYQINGKHIFSKKLTDPSVKIDELSPGAYLIHILLKNHLRVTKKLIVQD